ncbi:unnamed protein product [Kuraishia capsulata CBS 1993]|uniref:Uncharacterized protein n=1 Tax=Kuraishia capsulata CBS 1993 TaxID=1382522 RepID=W6MLM0_9ASCO|nr:uncharacterized protein KUCA_T00002975001 [Kuraishia capsulata CBS 1993]CDK26998.1 unnamed protein product [Kuraishia capsulata CBS 1993]
MGKIQKKNSKGRLDKYYYLAKEKGYRARSSFKILQINEKYGHFLEKSKVVIDLCAAPGSWCQVASQLCPVNSLIIGVDIVPIKPLPNCITFQSDITTEDCRSRLRGHMKTWKADTVLHDGAPNVGMGWVQDAFTQSHLTLEALKLAVDNLAAGGTFITKVFRSRDYNNLMWVFKQLFDKVEATKPPASRNVSAEIFVVCRGFKAPKKMDPRLLDAREVFEELPDGPVNNEAKVFNPEKKKRSRTGYDEDDYTLFHTMPLLEWVKMDAEVINTLGGLNQFTVDSTDPEWKILKKMKQTTTEFKECIRDLKVLGKKDFRMLIRWRVHARETLGIIDPKDMEKPTVEVEELTEDQKIDQELDALADRQRLKNKREKRRNNEMKTKEIQRMQMNMLTDMQIGLDAAQIGSESLFNLKTAEKTGQLDALARGKKSIVFSGEDMIRDVDIVYDQEEANTDEEVDGLEEQLDQMYNQYQERREERESRLAAKRARGSDDEAWDGIKDEKDESSSDGEQFEEDDSDISDAEGDASVSKLIAKVREKAGDGLSRKAAMFFNDDLFEGVDDSTTASSVGSNDPEEVPALAEADNEMDVDSDSSEEEEEEDFEIVPAEEQPESDSDFDSDDESASRKSHKNDVDIATVEAMTLAHQLALGRKTKHDLMDEGFNRYSFRDKEGLPEWFLDDENQHSKITKPITKEASLAMKEKLRQLNARPIKKVLEAQGRKKMRAMRRIEKLKKKSDMINDDDAKSERDKADEISKIMKKMTRKQKTKPQVTLVFAKGSNKGVSGRPKGIKGKYKMVDGTLKNEQRALRRIAKKHKKR